jgi:hypothetical protein
MDSPPRSVSFRSDPIDIEIVGPEPKWIRQKISESTAVLRRDPRQNCVPAVRSPLAVRGRGANSAARAPTPDEAARALRFLETPEAAVALARLYSYPVACSEELRTGLLLSPYSTEIVEAMEAALESPESMISQRWIDALISLTLKQARPLQSAEAERRRVELGKRLYDSLARAVERKQGVAREVAIATLASRPTSYR